MNTNIIAARIMVRWNMAMENIGNIILTGTIIRRVSTIGTTTITIGVNR